MEFISPNDDLRREQNAEWEALTLMDSLNFKPIFETANITPEVVIQHPDTKIIVWPFARRRFGDHWSGYGACRDRSRSIWNQPTLHW
jgi:hypothetical protein